jgi:hypothetical protein
MAVSRNAHPDRVILVVLMFKRPAFLSTLMDGFAEAREANAGI